MIDTSGFCRGFDASHFQRSIDFSRVIADPQQFKFAFFKATDGVGFTDPLFAADWRGAAAVGLYRGAYDFFRPDEDPEAEADKFLTTLGGDFGELGVVIDVENSTRPLVPADVQAIEAWLDYVGQQIGSVAAVMIYSSHSVWSELGNPSGFSQYPLWLTRYAPDPGAVPGDFGDWEFWQFTQAGRVQGVAGSVDLNVFHGSLQDLQALFGLEVAGAAPVPTP